MGIYFSLLIQEHKKLGQLFQPFLILEKGKDYCTIHDRLAVDKLHLYKSKLSPIQVKIVEIIESYNDKNITKRFANNKYNARDFLKTVKDDYVSRFIRPIIEKLMAKCVDLAREDDIPIYYRETKNVVYKSDFIEIEKEPAEIVFNFIKLANETHYFQTISHNGENITLKDKNGEILTNDPCWLLLDKKLYHFKQDVDGKKLALFFNKEFVLVPEKFEKKYFSTFVKNCIRDFPVKVDGILIKNLQQKKQPVISLENDFSGLPGLFINFNYGGQSLSPVERHSKYVNYFLRNGKHEFDVFFRDWEWERSILDFILDLGLKKSHENVYHLKDKQEKYDLVNWLNEHDAALKERGFLVGQEGDEIKYFTGSVEMVMRFEEKNDWFDVYAVAKFGDDFEIPIINLRKYLLNGIREFKLPDGTFAILPEEWFNKYSDLVLFGEKQKEKIRVGKPHFGLVWQSMQQSFTIRRDKSGDLAEKKINEKAALPEGVNAQLRSYQLAGYQWLYSLKKHNLSGCLADDMGLGKTLQTLTLLVKHYSEAHFQEQVNVKKVVGQIDLFAEIERLEASGNPSLVIMPSSLIHNWRDEILKFTPQLRHLIYTGAQRSELFLKIPHAQVVFTTYGTIRNDFDELKLINFDYIILDESQIIKNPTSKIAKAVYQLKGKHRLTLSGTPIENSLTDLWSQMNFLNPGLLRDLSFFKNYFSNPIEKNQDQEKQEKLHLLISPFILRRTKMQVEKELPELSEEYVYCDMTPEQEKIYQEEKISIRNFILENIEKNGVAKSAIVMLQALTKLRQLANHPTLIDETYQESSGKFDEVVRNLETLISEGHKVLVFSSFVKHLQVYINYFDENNLKYSVLTGKSQHRDKIIREFQTDQDRNVFFISLKAGGVGLNLTEADYVFMLDPWWNPQSENQAVNRAYRIGQTKHVFAYRFITLGTIEEKILKLQRKKSRLAEIFVRTDNPLKELNIDNIRELIE